MLLRRKDGRPEPVTVFDGPSEVWGGVRLRSVGSSRTRVPQCIEPGQQAWRWSADLTGVDRASVAEVVGSV